MHNYGLKSQGPVDETGAVPLIIAARGKSP